VAFAAVLVVVASGVVQAVRQVGSWAALTDTTYGRLLLVKVGLFVALLAAAAASRAWVRRRAAARLATLALSTGPGAAAASAEAGRTRLALLRQSVGVEVVLAIAVLAVTALLVNAVPGASIGSGAAGGEPFSTTVHGALTAVEISVDPAAVGPAEVEITVTDHAGGVLEPEEVTASLTLPDRNLGPLDVPLTPTGPGTYAAEDTEIPFAGTWLLEVDVRTSDIDQDQLAVDVPVAPVP
jgi:copper transport protein